MPSYRDVRVYLIKFEFWQATVNVAILAALGVALIAAGLVFRFPDSVPHGWPRVTGTVSSVIARSSPEGRRYYPVVQYLALGYSYDASSRKGYDYYPAVGTPFTVAFNPQEPQNALLAGETHRNYYAILPWLGAWALLVSAFRYTQAVWRNAHGARAGLAAILATIEPPQNSAALPVIPETGLQLAKAAPRPRRKPARTARKKTSRTAKR